MTEHDIGARYRQTRALHAQEEAAMTVTDEAVEAMQLLLRGCLWSLPDGIARAAIIAALPHLKLSLYCPSVRASVGKWRDDLEAKVAERDAEIFELKRLIESGVENTNVPMAGVERQQADISRLQKMVADDLVPHGGIYSVRKRTKELEEALFGITERYVDLVNSGDCGNWDPEEEEPVIAARAALEQAP